MLRALGVVALVALASCISFDEVHCSNGTVCPPDSRCDEVHGGCIFPQQVEACANLKDGETCNVEGAQGTCTDMVCHPWLCGNGVREGAEQCDGSDLDQNDCVSQGFYFSAGLACQANCRFDLNGCTGYCGDGLVNGPEQCDSAPPFAASCLDYSYDAGRLGCALCAPGFTGCTQFGWRREVSPSTMFLSGIWGSASNDVWIVGYAGTVLHYDGIAITAALPAPVTQNLAGVWASAHDNMLAVGDAGKIVRYDGTSFTVMPSNTTANLGGIWGSAPNDVYAVGASGTVVHFDGTSWTATTQTTSQLRAVWGTSAGDVYAVGAPGTSGTVLHYNGATWTPLAAPTNDFFAVWNSGSTVFVAGRDSVGGVPIIVQYDGTSWTTSYTDGAAVGHTITGIWGTNATDVFAVGDDRFLHFDGVSWSELVPPADLKAPKAVGGTPQGDVWAAGTSGYVYRWGGESWTTAQAPASTPNLRGIWAFDSSHAVAVGFGGTILHYTGDAWTTFGSVVGDLYAIWAAGPSSIFTVGINNSTGAGVSYEYAGSTWSALPGCTAALPQLLGVSGTSATSVQAVGVNGAFRSDTSNCWSSPAGQLTTTSSLFASWGSSSDLYAAAVPSGTTDVLFHYNGTTWATIALPPPVSFLNGVWGSASSDVFAVGDTIAHYDGAAWSIMLPPGQNLRAVSGTGPRNVFAVGDAQKLLHYDGVSWTPVRVPPPPPPAAVPKLRGVAATQRSVIVVGDAGYVNRLAFSVRPSETNCNDGWDDDGDGMPDCADNDCESNPYCMKGGACPYIVDLTCGVQVMGSTAGRTPARDYYTCDASAETGPEAIYRITPPSSGVATATLSGFDTQDLDLVVVGAMSASDACDPDFACLGASATTSGASETVQWNATAPRPYFVIVDGKNGAAGPFTLSVTCP